MIIRVTRGASTKQIAIAESKETVQEFDIAVSILRDFIFPEIFEKKLKAAKKALDEKK